MIVKHYAQVSEETARRAKQAYSFFDYVEGSATASYRKAVDECYEIACRAAEKRPKEEERIQRLFDRFADKLAANINDTNRNTASCPSVMISGGSNFPVRKKEKQNIRSNKLAEENNYIMQIPDKIRDIGNNTTIYSDEDDALEQLEAKADKYRAYLEDMKKQNAHYRKHGTMKGYENITDEDAEKLDAEIKHSFYKVPFPAYELTSARQKIKAAEERAEQLKKLKAKAERPTENDYPHIDGVEVVENGEAMRIQLIFDGKPTEEIRTILKSHGFRWSPSFNAWQRQLTANGKYATISALQQIARIEE
jgi:hypothetical protein